MRKTNFIYITALAATLLGSCSTAPTQDKSEVVIENILTRSSVRAYTDQPVEQEKIELMLRAAMAAPTAVNKQPWKFIVVTDKAILKELGASGAKMIAHAPLAIVPCGDMTEAFEKLPEYWVQDLSAATENMLLAAHALGLGAVWTGVYPTESKVKKVQEILSLPDHIVPLNVTPIGYPSGEPKIKEKWMPEKVHYNKW